MRVSELFTMVALCIA